MYSQWGGDGCGPCETFGIGLAAANPLHLRKTSSVVLTMGPPLGVAGGGVYRGNPPFLGYSKLRASLGHGYVEALFRLYGSAVSNQSDICCYWFERARKAIEQQKSKRAGLLATQAIRGGRTAKSSRRSTTAAELLFAYLIRTGFLRVRTFHVSLIGFDNGDQKRKSWTDARSARSTRLDVGIRSYLGTPPARE